MTKRFTHRNERVEIWQGNNLEQKLDFVPWFWRPLNDGLRINWHILGPFQSEQAARESAKRTIERIKDWYPVR